VCPSSMIAALGPDNQHVIGTTWIARWSRCKLKERRKGDQRNLCLKNAISRLLERLSAEQSAAIMQLVRVVLRFMVGQGQIHDR